MKANVVPVDTQAILDSVAALPIATWNLVTQSPDIRHVGPMAQDFHAAFRVGSDERYIATVDADGVALAAIQGLAARDRVRESAIASLQARNVKLEAVVQELADELRALKHSLQR